MLYFLYNYKLLRNLLMYRKIYIFILKKCDFYIFSIAYLDRKMT